MTFPMAGCVGWSGRMKNVDNDTKPRLEDRGKRQRFSFEQMQKLSAVAINGNFQGGNI